MPADRSRPLKRTQSEGSQFVWSVPTEGPTTPTEIAFATNVTPITFSDSPPPLVDAPTTEFILFPPPNEDCLPTRRQTHSKKKPENHIPRPPNAFILFRSSFIKSQHVSTEVETNHSTLSKIIGLTWQNLPEEERKVWHDKAKAALDEHKRKFPQYAFRPLQTKAKGGTTEKRKFREVEPKDLKRCAKIAELLIEGKKGHELDAAIQEFDKHHVPQIVTRFEAPITARAFRRSSSVPLPDQSFLPSSPTVKTNKLATRTTRSSSPDPLRNAAPQCNMHILDMEMPMTLKQESTPTMDFSSFSFDNISSSSPVFDLDPLSGGNNIPMADVNPFENQHVAYPPLSVDTSFLENWSQCTTPVYTGGSDYLSSPITSAPSTPSFMFDGFDNNFGKSFDDYSTQFSMYQPASAQDMGMQEPHLAAMNSDLESMLANGKSTQLAELDLDFAAFMTSIGTQY